MKRFLISLFLITNPLHSSQSQLHVVFAHGIVDGPEQASRFHKAFPKGAQIHTIAFPDTQSETGYGINRLISSISTSLGKPVNRSHMYMGQDKDITAIHDVISKLPQDESIILYGCSRGSAAIINYLAQHNPSNVVSIVLDATPADMIKTIDPLLATIGIPLSCDASIFTTLFPQYIKGIQTPIDSIKAITNKNLSICLIHSQKDNKVPYVHSLALYKTLQEHGFMHTHFISLSEGSHSFLLQDDRVKDIYLQGVHGFYNQYNIPHEAVDTKDVHLSQPSLIIIDQQLALYEQSLQKIYQKAIARNVITIALLCISLRLYLDKVHA